MSQMQARKYLKVFIKLELSSWRAHLIDQNNMKSKTKSHNEDDHNYNKAGGSLGDVDEHENVDAKEGHVLEVSEEVEPGESDQKGANRPLPTLKRKVCRN